MKRKEFLRRLGMAGVITPVIVSCSENSPEATTGGQSGSCTTTPAETAGPFPTKNPSTLSVIDIRSDRTGIEMTMDLTIHDRKNNCEPLAGATVDVWHCDKDGYYSEYGGIAGQIENFQSFHFLRGRQTTDSSGFVSFKTIFPGWYPGRAPHIHVHIYDSLGVSMLVTQIAFPTDICDALYSTATQFYTKGTQDTTNASDNVFSDSLTNELATVSGSAAAGYSLKHTITVG